MNWQPIETAPKDGSEILGHNVGYWDKGAFTSHWMAYGPGIIEPTNWMPLPEAPQLAIAPMVGMNQSTETTIQPEMHTAGSSGRGLMFASTCIANVVIMVTSMGTSCTSMSASLAVPSTLSARTSS